MLSQREPKHAPRFDLFFIYFSPIDYNTGKKEDFSNSKAIIEAFKIKDINSKNNKNLSEIDNYDKLIKFRQFY